MLTQSQKYSIATLLSVNTLEATLYKIRQSHLNEVVEGVEFAKLINKYYKKRDGFVPRPVIKMIYSKSYS